MRQEVAVMKLLNHPNVIRLYKFIDTKETLYIIMELVEGCELHDLISWHGQIAGMF